MKITQFYILYTVTFEITNQALVLTKRSLFKKDIQRIYYDQILADGMYEMKLEKSGYLILFLEASIGMLILVSSGNMFASNADLTWTYIFGLITMFFVICLFIQRYVIYIPTTNNEYIALFSSQPTYWHVRKFIRMLKEKTEVEKLKRKSNFPHVSKQSGKNARPYNPEELI